MKKKTVKKIFIFFFFFLPLQYAAVGIVGYYDSEPWPAFVFPGFKSVYDNSKSISVSKPVFIAQGRHQQRKLDSKILFEGVKESLRLGFIETNFSDSLKINHLSLASRKWLKEIIEKRYPDLKEPQDLHVHWIVKYYQNKKGKPVLDSTKVTKKFTIKL